MRSPAYGASSPAGANSSRCEAESATSTRTAAIGPGYAAPQQAGTIGFGPWEARRSSASVRTSHHHERPAVTCIHGQDELAGSAAEARGSDGELVGTPRTGIRAEVANPPGRVDGIHVTAAGSGAPDLQSPRSARSRTCLPCRRQVRRRTRTGRAAARTPPSTRRLRCDRSCCPAHGRARRPRRTRASPATVAARFLDLVRHRREQADGRALRPAAQIRFVVFST